ncbi:MAG: DMT family transporter [Chloroflexota bacterium]
MDTGLVFAFLNALFVGGSNIFNRRGAVYVRESFSPVVINSGVATAIFLTIILINGDWTKILTLSRQSLLLLVAAGIVHFVIGRFLSYTCIRLIGSTRASALFRSQMFYAVLAGIVFFHEALTWSLVAGVLLITAGATLVSTHRSAEQTGVRATGIVAGLTGGFFWGISSALAKPAIEEIGSPYAALFVSFAAAAVIAIVITLFRPRQRYDLRHLPGEALRPYLVSSLCNSTGNLFRYAALNYVAVSLVVPIMSTSGIFTVILSFLLNRRIEYFSPRILIGIAAATVGAIILV